MPKPPANEDERLNFLFSCDILDTPKDERFDRLTRLAALFYQADVSFIGFVDDRYQWMKSVKGNGVAPWIERDQSVCQIVIASGEPLVIGDMKTNPRLDGHPIVPHLSFRFYAGVPLLTPEGAAVASPCVLKREAQDVSEIDLAALTDLGAVAMDELELFRRTRELEQRADTDGLTGLANRRAFDAALDRAIRRARRTREPLSLLLLDLDHFKALNDTAGHMAGDEALRRFGQVLTLAARRLDYVAARYGGEEFAFILLGTDKTGAVEVARMAAEGLAAAAVPHPKGIGGVLTASIGATTVEPDSIQDAETLVARADAALYRAKGMGRNQVVHTANE